ncbi:hypothetical protein [Amycolatopsis circi]|uniref:hypothetical protein n=1 Tax=Amycolatopsis circi TaxID=871959 RepID=UPI000E282605|nr:hypothetical protein [Amycolatopsis circi]
MPDSTDDARTDSSLLDELKSVADALATAEDEVRKAIRVKEAADLAHSEALGKANELREQRRKLVCDVKAADPDLTTRKIGAVAQLSGASVSRILLSGKDS